MMRMSVPSSSRCVAKECLSVWTETRLFSFVARTAALRALFTVDGCRCVDFPGKSQSPVGRTFAQYPRSASYRRLGSITYLSFLPFPSRT